MKKHRNKIKLSNMLLDGLHKLKTAKLMHIRGKLEDFSCKCTEVIKNSHIFYASVDKGWFRSTDKIRSRVSRNLNEFLNQMQQFRDIINSDEAKLPKLTDIFADILQIEQEFGELQFDFKEMTVSIITEPIALDHIALGSFEIRLLIGAISKLYKESPYSIIALEPNPAGSDCDVTHPHVSHEKLCEGDGCIPIRKAIEQGRFCDFFTMVTNILQTYNPDSPYVALSEWEGISCYDCGYTVSGDDCYYCEDCSHDYCSQCSTYCQICDTTVCLGCSLECQACNQYVCYHCTAKCAECEETFCKDCTNEESLCQTCIDKRKEQEDEEQKEESTEPKAGPAVQPDSVGQVAIPA